MRKRKENKGKRGALSGSCRRLRGVTALMIKAPPKLMLVPFTLDLFYLLLERDTIILQLVSSGL